MEIKDNVRRRRQARMKALIDESLQPIQAQEAPNSILPHAQQSAVKHPTTVPYISADAHADPEIAWKEQHRLWRSQLAEGTAPVNGSDPPVNRPTSNWVQSLQIKFMLSALLFAGVWTMFQVNLPWTAKAKSFVVNALSEEMNFGAIAVWYEETFHGAPSFIPIFGTVEDDATKVNTSTVLYAPLQGKITSSYTEALKGVEIEATAVEPGNPIIVKSMDAGQVVDVTANDNNTYRVVVQHANELRSVYGGLQDAGVRVNDWIQGGQPLGTLSADEQGNRLFFAVEKSDRFIDPTDVISFD
ncbi:M23 family metallopeptidase [Paenibacillus guangzhouensis]|uniref:M23 family metallopeptidase n=1 Tax=Paenibacillus guangzhouensis TaxID=1473112 RepID=UPI001266AE8C|nr:M23 family metallopeptidase [Paenibacillus guangzhouensis]